MAGSEEEVRHISTCSECRNPITLGQSYETVSNALGEFADRHLNCHASAQRSSARPTESERAYARFCAARREMLVEFSTFCTLTADDVDPEIVATERAMNNLAVISRG